MDELACSIEVQMRDVVGRKLIRGMPEILSDPTYRRVALATGASWSARPASAHSRRWKA